MDHLMKARLVRPVLLAGALACLLSVYTPAPLAGAGPARRTVVSANIDDYIADKLQDFSAVMRVTQFNDAASKKISKDFGLLYQLRGDIHVRYKESDMYRLDGRYRGVSVAMVINGQRQTVRLASLFTKASDLGASPGKRKTLLDVGLISPSYLQLAEAQFVRSDTFNGTPCAVFSVSYRNKKLDLSHRIVWIDPKTRTVLKREEYRQTGELAATYLYSAPQEVVPGVWFPTRLTVGNSAGEQAVTAQYTEIHVNQGLPDTVFRL